MTETQFTERAKRIHALIEKLQREEWPDMKDEEAVAVLLDDARWKMHDIAYPA